MRTLFLKGMVIGAGIFAGLAVTTLVAVTVTSFTTGETLTAAKLNENFTALKASVESLSSFPHYEIQDATGTKIADVTGIGPITSTGYRIYDLSPALNSSTGQMYYLGQITKYYETTDCTGTAYFPGKNYKDILTSVDGNSYYVSESATPVNFAAKSYYSGSCSTSTFTSRYYFPLTANDPAVTGFDPSSYTAPLKYVKK